REGQERQGAAQAEPVDDEVIETDSRNHEHAARISRLIHFRPRAVSKESNRGDPVVVARSYVGRKLVGVCIRVHDPHEPFGSDGERALRHRATGQRGRGNESHRRRHQKDSRLLHVETSETGAAWVARQALFPGKTPENKLYFSKVSARTVPTTLIFLA